MELQDIFSIWDRFDTSAATRLELELEGVSLKLEKGLPVPASPTQQAALAPAAGQAAEAEFGTAQASALDLGLGHSGAPAAGISPASAPDLWTGQSETPAVEAGQDARLADAAYIRSPLVGVFYAAPGPDKAPFAEVGQTVQKGQSVCLLEAMKMMSEVPAPMDCIIQEVLLQDGQLADFDAPLFRVQPL